MKDVFPDIEFKNEGYEDLKTALRNSFKVLGYIANENQVKKATAFKKSKIIKQQLTSHHVLALFFACQVYKNFFLFLANRIDGCRLEYPLLSALS